jgi:hypothetical protein
MQTHEILTAQFGNVTWLPDPYGEEIQTEKTQTDQRAFSNSDCFWTSSLRNKAGGVSGWDEGTTLSAEGSSLHVKFYP